ncbi:hypothetical protein BpHYR1_050534 [Brachionus plicatilis]|uniref:Uncharacterized protein n=1 Tax=Brachionus plicatilis TaxID=10195 RepID=A0A3M7P2W3_BRAPC|nr:hypothetical protein BpHYR1_050534 [Brachionus plicatilis]
MAISASKNATAWCSAINLPIVFLSRAYFLASSKARLAKPTAPAATGGLVKSKAPMAILNPAPSTPKTFSLGTLTSSKVMPLVSEARCPMFHSLRPLMTPSVSASTIKPVNAFEAGHLGSEFVLARTKYQLAYPPFVIHIF